MTTGQTTTKPLVVYFGTANRGKGIHVFEMDQETGYLTERGVTEITGRGWIELDPTERFLYAATDPDQIASFAVDQDHRPAVPAELGADGYQPASRTSASIRPHGSS